MLYHYSEIDAVIFDFDGVIIQSVDIKNTAFVELFSRFPSVKKEALEFHQNNIGHSRILKFKYLIDHLLPKEIVSRQNITVESLSKEFSNIIFNKICTCPEVPGAIELIKQLKDKNIYRFIASITPHDELQNILENRNIINLFTQVLGTTKTKDFLINEILTLYNLNPSRVLFIGDTIQDYQAAIKTKVIFAGLGDKKNFPDNVSVYSSIDLLKKEFINL